MDYSMLLGLATERAEILEFFLNQLSVLCDGIKISLSFWTTGYRLPSHPGRTQTRHPSINRTVLIVRAHQIAC